MPEENIVQNIGRVIGIDLGTTNSLAAIDQGDGNPIILRTSSDEFFTPSVVSFGQGTLLVGRQALNNADKAPTDTIFSIKRLMGRSFDDKDVKSMKEKYPHSIIEHPNNEVRVLINGIEYTPEDVSEMILRQVVEDASKALNGQQITHAVVTVPAYFSEIQRAATRSAGERAGLVIKKIIDEPTAAAIAFGFGKDKQDEYPNLLVFDMGGGTTDVSLLYVGNREFVGDAITGDMWLGGDNFDNKIVDIIIDWVKQNYGENIDPSTDKDFKMAAKRKAEETKKLLSDHTQVSIIIPNIVPLGGGKKGQVTMTISRSEFEERIRDDVNKSIDLVHQLMKRNKLDADDISKVLLVGGVTYIPLVRKRLGDIFGKEKVSHDVNPMEAVVMGAAILAAQLRGIVCPKKDCNTENTYEAETCSECGTSLVTGRTVGGLGLHEATERDFGIGAVDQNDEQDAFSVLIPAGTSYPLKEPGQHKYMTTSREIIIPVYVGDKQKKASENEYLGRVEYELPQDVPSKTPVIVSFNYDRNRILTVGIEIVGRPELKHKTTPKRYAANPAGGSEDKSWTKLRNAIEFVETMSKDYGEFFEPEQKREIEKGLQNARKVMKQKDQRAAQEALGILNQLIENNGIVTSLHLSDRLMLEVDSRTSEFLAEQSKILRDAYRQSPRDINKVNQIQRVLQKEILHIFENFKVNPEIRTYGGLLKIMDDPAKKSAA